ncbi:MAG: aminotransferase class I/II-fold pyridoxal phosphate-dependent enzyme [Vicinamibacterales bacterium]|jgi:aspartate/methionine/tyrosine aminotransferase|nr:aminotransferase class I/II-fold pyridoxal phosphate-dependent enzyme [Vicinamibacterales bacterium]
MRLAAFELDHWLEAHRGARYDLAASTGPRWTIRELFALAGEAEREAFLDGPVSYCPNAGHDDLRQAIGDLHGVAADDVQIVTGAAEGLLVLFFLAAEPGANIVVPAPCFPTFVEVPRGLGLDVRTYELRPENRFAVDVDEVARLIDGNTKLLLVNTPHNPSGAVVDLATLTALHDLAVDRGVQLVVDEVYHPIYHGEPRASAAELPHCTVLGDFSKAFSLSGLRTGWIVDRDRTRHPSYLDARSYFTVSNAMPGERLAVLAARHAEQILARGREIAAANLASLDRFFEAHPDRFSWVRPEGGFTTFPALAAGGDARPLCEAAAAKGVVLGPGDCFGRPAHLRIGFGACTEGFDDALALTAEAVRESLAVAS